VGFGMTLPPSYSWFPRGARLRVPYEAAQGRRVNAIGAYFTHGPRAGHLETKTWAALPKSRAKKRQPTLAEQAAAHGLREEDVGPIDAARFVAFIWQVAQRPQGAPAPWRRERPLWIVLDNYSVHTSQTVAQTRPAWPAAGIELVYLPAYCPELSAIEPIWNDTKQHHLPTRSFSQVAQAKSAVETALAAKAQRLREAAEKTTTVHRRAA
jgi:transposase